MAASTANDVFTSREKLTEIKQGLEALSERVRRDLEDEAKQALYGKAYLAQLRARSCPGCGETDIF
jgi:hypothetical protein